MNRKYYSHLLNLYRRLDAINSDFNQTIFNELRSFNQCFNAVQIKVDRILK